MAVIYDETGMPVEDETGMPVYDELGMPVTLGVESACNVFSGMSAGVTMKCNVGAPYQGGIRGLAADRWLAMYPS